MRKTIALAVAAVALAGCGALPGRQGGGGEERQSQAVVESPAGKQESTAPQESPSSQESPAAQQQSAQESAPIATREVEVSLSGDRGKARADINELKRQGRTLTLTWRVTATDGRVVLGTGLGTGPTDYTVSGVSLIDPVNAKRYRVARNGPGQDAECVCSATMGNRLETGEASTLYAVFAAPPPDVTKINIEMPMIGVFTDVPIS
ncbi:hypothetical protein FH608_003020 [Nonomuraea phyllanthi]|uniref:Uncharacterized protein n=1 Tax=Nonomuraea phyllanthi TaxID=2219224 RepID=A0A5C4WY39_9ACTN|nr:hypothetical protein [Nonomuraea phyllanthi]KAB8197539.1 hypothetical protein FH608_003020 [Nonomuraea phyllanthi]